jgi:signal transduction histidine kinase/CheY-like chemotaxis protein
MLRQRSLNDSLLPNIFVGLLSQPDKLPSQIRRQMPRYIVCALCCFTLTLHAADFVVLHKATEAELRKQLSVDPGDINMQLALAYRVGELRPVEGLELLASNDFDKSADQRSYQSSLACILHIRNGDMTGAEPNCEAIISDLENRQISPEVRAMGHNARGYYYLRHGTAEPAINAFKEGLLLVPADVDPVIRITLLHNRATALSLAGFVDEAVASFEIANAGKSVLPADSSLPAILAYNLGFLQAQKGRHEAALKSYQIVIDWLASTNQLTRAFIAHTQVSLSLSATGRHQRALDELLPWVDRQDFLATGDSKAHAYLALGNAYMGLGQQVNAREVLNLGVELAGTSGNPNRLRELSLAYASMLLGQQDYQGARTYLVKLIDRLTGNAGTAGPNTGQGLEQAHLLLSKAEAGLGNFAAAYQQSLQSAEAQEIWRTSKFDRRLASLRISNELDVKDQQLGLALERETAARLSQRLSQRLSEVIGVSAIGGALVVILLIYLLLKRRNHWAEVQLRQAANEHLVREVAARTREVEQALGEQHLAEQASAALKIRLTKDDNLRSLGQLTGGVAHDFNNLLTIILLSAELLQLELNESQQSLIEDIIGATVTGQSITRGLLAYARRQALHPTIIDLRDYLPESLSLFRRSLDETILLSQELPDNSEPLLVNADTGQLTSCLINLIINAREAIGERGHIRMQAESRDDKIAITVVDDGCGMTDHDLEHATEPFYSTKDASKGTGLGLSMAYGFMKQSGGELIIESDINVGTRVILLFSTASSVGKASQPPRITKADNDATGKVILLVEDEPQIRQVCKIALQKVGYTVLIAENGDQAALVLSTVGDLDLLISDMVMPGTLSASELVTQSRQHFPALPVLLMSGYSRETPAGCDFIAKPFSLTDLRQAVMQALSLHGSDAPSTLKTD